MGEILFKILLTVFVTYFYLTCLSWIWTRQVDIKETFLGLLKKETSKPVEWIATRDPNAIYQNGKIVGNVSRDVKEIGDRVIFYEIFNTSTLKKDLPLEYKRLKLKIIRIEKAMGVYSNGTEVKHSVIQNVVCEKIR